jgi:Tfp pilus assembly PilM family ATPase
MPPGAISFGVVHQPGAVAIALRRVFESMGISGQVRAAVGIPAPASVMRNLVIPPAPDSELGTIVTGEVEHYQVLRSKGGAHTFMKLQPPTRMPDAEPISVVVLGAEEEAILGLRALADRADLQIVALEPIQFAMFRAVAAQNGPTSTSFEVLMGETNTDVAFLYKGNLMLYRKLDIGSKPLIQTVGAMPSAGMASSIFSSPFDETQSAPSEFQPPPVFQSGAADTLTTEIHRSLEYLAREYPEFAVVDKLSFVLDEPNLEPFAASVGEKLGIAVEIVSPPSDSSAPKQVAQVLSSPEGLHYTAAVGLALRDSAALSSSVPRIDLFAKERSAVQTLEKQRNLAGSLAVSAVALVLGVVGYVLFNGQIASIQDQVNQAKARTAKIQSDTSATLADRALHLKQYALLRREGAPLGPVMDYVVGSLEPGAGLTQVTISPDLLVTFKGEAIDEGTLIRTAQNLQKSPILQALSIGNFGKTQNGKGPGVEFQIMAKTIPMDQILLPGEKRSDRPK